MNLVDKLMRRPANSTPKTPSGDTQSLLNGSLDTLDAVLRATGEFAIEVEDEDPRFQDLCKEYARHVTNGVAIPDEGIEQTPDGSRHWGRVRSFFVDRRQLESDFINERFSNYRLLVDDMVNGFRHISSHEADTASSVMDGLSVIQHSTRNGDLAEIRRAIADTTEGIKRAFEEQRQYFTVQIDQANKRMLQLRDDLATAREDLRRDPLTDTFNRGAFDIAITQSISMNFILRQPVCVAMLDLDHFKRINDRFGHAAGDDVLRGVADCLSRTFVRRSDVVARYGGEEFALILNDVTLDTANTLLQRLLDMIRTTVTIPYADAGETLTCSAGVTELLPTDTVETVMLRADKAMYQAKSDGRNRIHSEP